MVAGDRCCVLSSLEWFLWLACMIQQYKESKSVFVDKKCLSRLFISSENMFSLCIKGLSKYESLYSFGNCKYKVQFKKVSDKFLAFCFVSLVIRAGSYDGEIIVWNNSTEKALRKLRPHAEHDYKKQQGLTFTVNSNPVFYSAICPTFSKQNEKCNPLKKQMTQLFFNSIFFFFFCL